MLRLYVFCRVRRYEPCYLPQRSWGKVIFSVACFKNSFHRGVSLQGEIDTPLSRRPTPWQGDPQAQCMLGDTGNKRAVPILLECILVSFFSIAQHFPKYTNKCFGADSPVILLFMDLISKLITDKKLRVY